MPDTRAPLFNLPVSVVPTGGIVTALVPVTLPLSPPAPLANLLGAVNAAGQLLITTG